MQIGTEVEVTGKTRFEGKDWYRVAHAGTSAYVFGRLLREKHKIFQEEQERNAAKPVKLEEKLAQQRRPEEKETEQAGLPVHRNPSREIEHKSFRKRMLNKSLN